MTIHGEDNTRYFPISEYFHCYNLPQFDEYRTKINQLGEMRA